MFNDLHLSIYLLFLLVCECIMGISSFSIIIPQCKHWIRDPILKGQCKEDDDVWGKGNYIFYKFFDIHMLTWKTFQSHPWTWIVENIQLYSSCLSFHHIPTTYTYNFWRWNPLESPLKVDYLRWYRNEIFKLQRIQIFFCVVEQYSVK